MIEYGDGRSSWVRRGIAGLLVAVAIPACAHVSQEELDGRIQDLRQEMGEGDRENADRISDLEQRVDGVEGRLDALERDLSQLRSDFDAAVERLETALRFSAPVHFGFDEAELRPEHRELLDRFAGVVGQHYDDAMITVEGFTDPVGSEAYNLELGQRRADAVREYLVGRAGLSDDRVRAVSYGESQDRLIQPDASGPGEEGWENRRVVMVIEFRPDATPPR